MNIIENMIQVKVSIEAAWSEESLACSLIWHFRSSLEQLSSKLIITLASSFISPLKVFINQRLPHRRPFLPQKPSIPSKGRRISVMAVEQPPSWRRNVLQNTMGVSQTPQPATLQRSTLHQCHDFCFELHREHLARRSNFSVFQRNFHRWHNGMLWLGANQNHWLQSVWESSEVGEALEECESCVESNLRWNSCSLLQNVVESEEVLKNWIVLNKNTLKIDLP
jgi:hypothetical protein